MIEKRRRWLLTTGEWKTAVAVSAVVGLLVGALTINVSPWVGIVAAVTVLTVYHMVHAAHYIVPLPHVVILVSALQYVLAGWLGTYFPPLGTLQDTSSAFPVYLTYAGPVIVVVAAVWFLCLPKSSFGAVPAGVTGGVLFELDLLIVVGLLAAVGSRVIPNQGPLAFVFQLVASLRYVGVFGRMVARERGWWWRLAIVIAAEVLFAVNQAMFHPLMLWGMWSVAVWLFAFRPARRTILIALLAAGLLLPALQEAKWRLRGNLEDEISEPNADALASVVEKSVDWLQYLEEGIADTLTLRLSPEFLSDTAARYNQGWIVTRVMLTVPEGEPYAMGETLKDAAVAAVLPRVFAPNKIQAGGRELMARYAATELSESTSMNLGYAGEMYANFGLLGGIIGCGCYALVAALAFRKLAGYATTHPLWWSVIPFVFFPVVKAEDDIAFVLNWAVKGAIVLAAVIVILPNFRRALFATVAPQGPFATVETMPITARSA